MKQFISCAFWSWKTYMHACKKGGVYAGEGWGGERCVRVLGEWRRPLGRVFLGWGDGGGGGRFRDIAIIIIIITNQVNEYAILLTPKGDTLLKSPYLMEMTRSKIAMIWCHFWSHILSETVLVWKSVKSVIYHIYPLHPINK